MHNSNRISFGGNTEWTGGGRPSPSSRGGNTSSSPLMRTNGDYNEMLDESENSFFKKIQSDMMNGYPKGRVLYYRYAPDGDPVTIVNVDKRKFPNIYYDLKLNDDTIIRSISSDDLSGDPFPPKVQPHSRPVALPPKASGWVDKIHPSNLSLLPEARSIVHPLHSTVDAAPPQSSPIYQKQTIGGDPFSGSKMNFEVLLNDTIEKSTTSTSSKSIYSPLPPPPTISISSKAASNSKENDNNNSNNNSNSNNSNNNIDAKANKRIDNIPKKNINSVIKSEIEFEESNCDDDKDDDLANKIFCLIFLSVLLCVVSMKEDLVGFLNEHKTEFYISGLVVIIVGLSIFNHNKKSKIYRTNKQIVGFLKRLILKYLEREEIAVNVDVLRNELRDNFTNENYLKSFFHSEDVTDDMKLVFNSIDSENFLSYWAMVEKEVDKDPAVLTVHKEIIGSKKHWSINIQQSRNNTTMPHDNSLNSNITLNKNNSFMGMSFSLDSIIPKAPSSGIKQQPPKRAGSTPRRPLGEGVGLNGTSKWR